MKAEVSANPMAHTTVTQRKHLPIGWLLAGLALLYVLLSLFAITPITRLAGEGTQWWITDSLNWFGRWIPIDFHLSNDGHSQQNTAFLELMLLLGGIFVVYIVSAFSIYRLRLTARWSYWIIWAAIVLVGIAFLFSEGLLSQDINSYVSYGRLLAFHSANPYFIPPSAFPKDPIYPSLYWKDTPTTYGPIWTVASAGLALLSGGNITNVVLTFRVFALCAHLVNILLVTGILRVTGRSEKTIIAGTLLYAWNPLVISESALGGHNDIFMVTFLLLGFLVWARTERANTGHISGYLLALVILTLSALIKFSSLPAIGIGILALFIKVLRSKGSKTTIQRWVSALVAGSSACIICIATALILYAPFWLGHRPSAIVNSFTSLPSMQFSFNSLLFTLDTWNEAHPLPHILSRILVRQNWNRLNVLMMLIPIILGSIGLWRTPEKQTRTIALISMACLSAFLIFTPWFFDWYATWIVGLMAVCLPMRYERVGLTCTAFTLAFSATAFFTYYSSLLGVTLPHYDRWAIPMSAGEIGIPLLVALAVLIFTRKIRLQSQASSDVLVPQA